MKNAPSRRSTYFAVALALAAGVLMGFPTPDSTAQQGNRQLTQGQGEPVRVTQRRIALVIGNGAYAGVPVLKNPPNDATLVAATLKNLGFDVTSGLNQTQLQMKRLVREFGAKLRVGGGVGLFYFAGHGVQSKGRNFLIPVDAEIQTETDLEDAAVDVNYVLGIMDDAQNGLNIVILDACRNNPFASSFRAVQGGLAQVTAPTGTLIAYATSPGNIAADGGGSNSPYTEELARQMVTSGVLIETMFRHVTEEVSSRTGGRQEPWYSNNAKGEFYFKPSPKTASLPSENETAQPTKIDAVAIELDHWEAIRNSVDPRDYQDYLQSYPSGAYAGVARAKIRQLQSSTSDLPSSQPSKTGSQPFSKPTDGNDDPSVATSASSSTRPPNAPAGLRSFDFLTASLDRYGALRNRDHKSAYVYAEDLGGGIKLDMVAIPPGEFMMGSPDDEEGREHDEGPRHRVRIGYWFYIGKIEVTQAQWRAVMGNNPSHFKGCDPCPVEGVSWGDAQKFCRKLLTRTGMSYRLPSESEWEYAARAGTATAFAFGENITPELVNYNGTIRNRTTASGSIGVANGFGLYDMLGNVYEWCEDWYHESYAPIIGDAPNDGSAWIIGGEQKERVLRGGSWASSRTVVRSANRDRATPNTRNNLIGFRIVTSAKAAQ
jgi:formylglycine-generating enzyme required for sulfatase activity